MNNIYIRDPDALGGYLERVEKGGDINLTFYARGVALLKEILLGDTAHRIVSFVFQGGASDPEIGELLCTRCPRLECLKALSPLIVEVLQHPDCALREVGLTWREGDDPRY